MHATSALLGEVGALFRRKDPGEWIILFAPELHFGSDVLVPDLAGWRRARLPNVPAEAYLTLAPDWICEVLSTYFKPISTSSSGFLLALRSEHWWWTNTSARSCIPTGSQTFSLSGSLRGVRRSSIPVTSGLHLLAFK